MDPLPPDPFDQPLQIEQLRQAEREMQFGAGAPMPVAPEVIAGTGLSQAGGEIYLPEDPGAAVEATVEGQYTEMVVFRLGVLGKQGVRTDNKFVPVT